MMEVVVTAGTIRCSKLQSKSCHQQTNTYNVGFYRLDAFLSPFWLLNTHLVTTNLYFIFKTGLS